MKLAIAGLIERKYVERGSEEKTYKCVAPFRSAPSSFVFASVSACLSSLSHTRARAFCATHLCLLPPPTYSYKG